MLKNKICLILCTVMLASVLFGCQPFEKEKPEDFFAYHLYGTQINDRLPYERFSCPFLDSARKGRKEADIGGGFLQRRPLLCTTPPKADRPEDFNNQAEMCRFPPIRPQMYRCRNAFESAAGVSKGGAFARSAPLLGFFSSFSCRNKKRTSCSTNSSLSN